MLKTKNQFGKYHRNEERFFAFKRSYSQLIRARGERRQSFRCVVVTSMARTTPLSLTVYCASSQRVPQLYADVAAELGKLIALRGYTLVYGGGNIGLMAALAQAALAHGGRVKGVILTDFIDRGYA